jgi:hypothetical protein
MNVIPGDALTHNVHGASARPRNVEQQPQFRPDGAQAHRVAPPLQAQAVDKVEAPRPAAPIHYVERPIADAQARPAPRGSALDITV